MGYLLVDALKGAIVAIVTTPLVSLCVLAFPSRVGSWVKFHPWILAAWFVLVLAVATTVFIQRRRRRCGYAAAPCPLLGDRTDDAP
jgi:hypothetical protein